MAKRFTDTDKWKKTFVKGLPAKYKLLWFYILDDCDLAGLWHTDFDVAQLRIGESISEKEALATFKEKIVVLDGGDKWFIPSFIEFQYGNEISKQNNIFRSLDKILSKYDLYQYIEVNIVDVGTTTSAMRGRLSQKMKDKIIFDSEFTCQYCSEQKPKIELVVDHFVPIERGGDNSDDNLLCSCIRCNSHKTDLTPQDFLSRPHQFLNPTEKTLTLLNAVTNYLNAPDKKLLPPKDKDKDKDKDKEKVNSNSTISKLKREYSELPKTKESIVEFFNSQNKKPLFSEPYMDIYNLFAKEHNYPLIQDITGSRGQKLHTRFADTKFYFLEILKQAKDQDFNVKGNNFLTFDWIIENDNNFRKILDGNYRKKPQLPDTNQQSDQPKRIIEKA